MTDLLLIAVCESEEPCFGPQYTGALDKKWQGRDDPACLTIEYRFISS